MKCASDFRRIARESLKGKWLTAIFAGIISWIFGATQGRGPDFNFGYSDVDGVQMSLGVLGQDIRLDEILLNPTSEAVLMSCLAAVSILALVIAIVQLVVSGVIATGYARFNMNLVDGKEARVGTLLDYFPQWKTLFVAGILQAVYIFLWSLLFIIPGIIAAYRYAMTYYILAENPQMRANEAITRSKEIMVGNKWRFFCLQISFIGWQILCVLTLGIGSFFLNPYMGAANAAFYRDLMGYVETATVPPQLSNQL